MKIVTTEKTPIVMWLDDLDEDTLQQLRNLANLPCAFKHVAAMPDSHLGYGMPIGGVFASKDVVIPNAVGVDIGCGMLAAKTSIVGDVSQASLKSIMGKIRNAIPVGFNHHKTKQQHAIFDAFVPFKDSVVASELESAKVQLGTLGGGNHFIEMQRGSDGHLWVMIHSGSRNVGFKVAKHYNNLAMARNEGLPLEEQVPKKWELAYLPVESEEAQRYLVEMNFCVTFALANRQHMMSNIMQIIQARWMVLQCLMSPTLRTTT
jgi:tRNA-splicing ligase RtcB